MKQHVVIAIVAAVATSPGIASAQSKPGMGGGKQAAPTSTVDLRACNRSGRSASVAVSYVEIGTSQFVNRGWYDVAAGSCVDLPSTDNANFYFYADATDGSGRRWQGGHTLCVEYPGPYTFYSTGGTECAAGQEVRNFVAAHADEPGPWIWNLDP
ncbi:DUF1036 domain-containing protein [Brevundimonas sp. NPDC092305]|uniref:DUF1036 domain-containing protein n=1 Tax=Brevundimonas sp. NPDC092305 TaxID=3363957 RepID=UPI003828E362